MNEGRVIIFLRRLFIMILALIAPELMITWAAIQFLSARDAAKAFNVTSDTEFHQACSDNLESTVGLLNTFASDGKINPHPSTPRVSGRHFEGWTVTYGFLAWMGGFMLYYGDEPRATLTPEELKRFVDEGSVEAPIIVKADIEGRSKGDALSKGIAILQLGWFVLQLVARYIQHLPITLLEIDTLAIVSLACIAYGLWWDKPKDVRRPYAVHWKAPTPPPGDLYYDTANQEFSRDEWHHYLVILIYPLRSLMGTAVTISPCAVRERRIPSLGGYDVHNPHDRNHVITLFLGCFSAVITGVVHFLAWNYLFQGQTEQMLWRVASVVTASTSVPCLLIFGSVIVLHVVYDSWIVRLSVVTIGFIYIATRIMVIVLIFSSLRSLPPGVYDTVAWTMFVPHF
jgi:hypothetical protein